MKLKTKDNWIIRLDALIKGLMVGVVALSTTWCWFYTLTADLGSTSYKPFVAVSGVILSTAVVSYYLIIQYCNFLDLVDEAKLRRKHD